MTAQLISALEVLQKELRATRLPLPTPESAAAGPALAVITEQLDDYVLPRLRSIDAPLLAVVGGSTGSGKSTLVNSLVGRPISKPGVLRPTTRHPVLVHHPADEAWFIDTRVLPKLPRVTERSAPGQLPGAEEIFGLQLVGDPGVPSGLALLDAPDLDSVSGANRELAALLMAAADLWVFVTTAARYADAVPWAALRSAVDRNAAIALILNRVPPESMSEVSEHLRSILATEGLGGAPLFVVPEAPLVDDMIPTGLVEPVHQWMVTLAGDLETRQAVAKRTLDGAIANVVTSSLLISDAAHAQVTTLARLRAMVAPPFNSAGKRVMDVSADGSLLRGEVLARWQDFVGAGELFQKLESTVARWRDKISAGFRGEDAPPERVTEAIETGLARVLIDAMSTACEQVDGAWRADPAGLVALDGRDLALPAPETGELAMAVVSGWQSDVLALIRSEGEDKRQTARMLAFGVNGVALTLMVLVFSATGGLTGAEVGIAGGGSVLAHKVLEATFSEDQVRRMAEAARMRLAERVDEFFGYGAARFHAQLDRLQVGTDSATVLRGVSAVVEELRDPTSALALLPAAPAGAFPEPAKDSGGWRGSLKRWWRGDN
ncbi:MAG: ABC transporter [Candidatus Nanopelagicales bacterium]